MTARPTAEEIVQMLRPDELMKVHGHTLVMADPEECDEDDYDDEEPEDDYEDEEPDYDLFPVCPICYCDWEYIGTTNRAKCEGGHEWQEVA